MSAPDYSISTPENVDLHLELAGCGNRILATLIDTIITVLLIIAFFVIYLAVIFLGKVGMSNTLLFTAITILLVLAIFIVNFGYYIFFEGRWGGQTPGKKFAGIRVVEQNGQPVSWSSVWIRNLLRVFDEGFFIIGLISMLIDKSERRIGDFAANTIVIRERLPEISTSDLKLTSHLSAEEHFDVGRITPQEYELLVAFLKRRQNLDHGHRPEVASKLANYFCDKLQATATDTSTSTEQFLEQLFLSYQARAEL